MARRLGGFIGTIVIGGLLAGCGMRMFAEREPWRREAEQECLASGGVQATAYTEPMPAINGSASCGMDRPFRITALRNGTVELTSRAVLACPVINTIDHWLNDVVQPAAQLYFGTTVVAMRAGSYSCRGVNGRPGARLSEHSFGNAADVFAFRFADGRELTVARGWRGDPRERDFLREVFTGACHYFSTVLAPGSDVFHYDHFHIDLARRTSGRTVCKPAIQFASRLMLARARHGGPTSGALAESRFGPVRQTATVVAPDAIMVASAGDGPRAGARDTFGRLGRVLRGAGRGNDFADDATDEDQDAGQPLSILPRQAQLGAAARTPTGTAARLSRAPETDDGRRGTEAGNESVVRRASSPLNGGSDGIAALLAREDVRREARQR